MNRTKSLAASVLIVLLGGCASTPDKQVSQDESIEELVASARQLTLQDDYTDALKRYEKAISLAPDNVELQVELGHFFLAHDEVDSAAGIFGLILEQAPANLDAMEGMGVCQLRLGNYNDARSWFAGVLSAAPQRARSLNYSGVLADIEGDYKRASSYYRSALALEPDNALYLNNAAYSKIMQREYEQAEKLLLMALATQPRTDSRIRNNLLIAYAWQGRYEKAVEVVAPGLDDAVVFNNVGYIALLRKDYPVAIDYFQRALTLSPTYYHRAELNLEKAQRLQKKSVATAG